MLSLEFIVKQLGVIYKFWETEFEMSLLLYKDNSENSMKIGLSRQETEDKDSG